MEGQRALVIFRCLASMPDPAQRTNAPGLPHAVWDKDRARLRRNRRAPLMDVAKALVSAVLLWGGQCALAGEYYNQSQIDTYDPSTGLYFKAVERRNEDRGLMSSAADGPTTVNINIFDPTSGKSRLLFKEPPRGTITVVMFEASFKDGVIEFVGDESSHVKNNKSVAAREPKGKVLVAVKDAGSKRTVLLVADKRTGNPTPVASVADGDDWHIDVRNAKIRVVHQNGRTLKIDSYEW